MKHLFLHACAGSGKTKYIVDTCIRAAPEKRRLILTLTTAGQDELNARLRKSLNPLAPAPEVMGWYTFLIHHVVRPYLPLVFPGQRIASFSFDSDGAKRELRFKKKSDPLRYFSRSGMVYRENLEELAALIMSSAGGLVENRLALIYDELMIDEVQDISRSGLDVIERLLIQKDVHCLFVGDVRQSILDSSLSSQKNKKADRQNLIEWYRLFEAKEFLEIRELAETYRFNQAIADFSDSIFPKSLGFASTLSRMKQVTSHDGVFLVAEEDLEDYVSTFNPKVLRGSKRSWKGCEHLDPINFGVSKGRTYPRVIILATKPIESFCMKHEFLADMSACGFYVAVTRAQYSVAIAVRQSRQKLATNAPSGFQLWSSLPN